MFKTEGKRPKPSMFDPQPTATNRQRGDKHEADTAKVVKGRTQPNSGAGDFLSIKGDVVSEDYLYQCKLTDKNRFTINEKIIGEITRQAVLTGKQPVIVTKMEAITPPLANEWVSIPMALWLELMERNNG